MTFLKKPTGQAETPIQIRRAKNIKLKIDAEEVIGLVGGNNESDIDENEVLGDSDVSSTRWSLVAANLSADELDEGWRPQTKKQRGFHMINVIERLTEVNRDSATAIEQAIIGMGDHNLENSVESLKRKFEVVERETADIKMEMSKIFSLLGKLNEKL